MAKLRLVFLVALLVSVLTPAITLSQLYAVNGAQPQGPVTIKTAIDFSSFPFHGTFAVTDGSGILGCSGGTFMDTPININGFTAIEKTFTCTSGAGAGYTFTYLFNTAADAFSGGNANGHWVVFGGTGPFATLRGQGDFSLLIVSPNSGVETLTGTIHFE